MTTGESCAHGGFPAQLSEGLLPGLGDSGPWLLLRAPRLCPLECRASCVFVSPCTGSSPSSSRCVCVCAAWRDCRSLPHQHCPVVSSEVQQSLPLIVPLEQLFQTHSTIQHQALVFSWMFSWERVLVQCNGGVRINTFCLPARP